jgi:hypothetical protein
MLGVLSMIENELDVFKVSAYPNPFESRIGHIFVGKFQEGSGSFSGKLVYTKGDILAFERRDGKRLLVDLRELRGLFELPAREP